MEPLLDVCASLLISEVLEDLQLLLEDGNVEAALRLFQQPSLNSCPVAGSRPELAAILF